MATKRPKNAQNRPRRAEPGSSASSADLSHIHEQLRSLAVPIDELNLDPKNARKHDGDNLKAIAASLRTYGIRKPIVVQIVGKKKIVRAGNGTVEAAKLNGWSHVPAVLVAEDNAAATGFAIADNRTAELSEWDNETLAELLGDLPLDGIDADLAEMFGNLDAEIDAAIAAVTGSSPGGDVSSPATIEDEIPSPPKKIITRPGDLWLLGTHRLLCGDSTRPSDVARLMGTDRAGLMNTDPPYGVAYANDERPNPGVAKPRVANDGLEDEKLQAFLESAFKTALDSALVTNAAWYLWHAHLTQGYFAAAAAAANVMLHRQIIWVKPVLLLGRGQYHWKHEPCFMGWVKGNQPPDYGLGNGERTQTTVWELKSVSHAERKEFDHATPKPVELFAIPIAKHLKPGEICFEPFAGSGPQFIAAEQLGRRCYGLELEPKFCDVIVARWEKLTGQKAERIAADGAIPAAA